MRLSSLTPTRYWLIRANPPDSLTEFNSSNAPKIIKMISRESITPLSVCPSTMRIGISQTVATRTAVNAKAIGMTHLAGHLKPPIKIKINRIGENAYKASIVKSTLRIIGLIDCQYYTKGFRLYLLFVGFSGAIAILLI
mgnify:CR=1 FL=1